MQRPNRKLQQNLNYLKESFQDGYKNASLAFSEISRDKIYYNNFHHSLHSMEINSISKMPFINRAGANVLTSTEIFGDISGKSYLLLGEHEFEVFTENIELGKNVFMDRNIKIEFMKELHNILTTSVTSKLNEHLSLKMYGNIPTWTELFDGNIANLIHHDFNNEAQDIYINCIYFSLDANPQVQPFFIWVLHSNVLETINKQPTTTI